MSPAAQTPSSENRPVRGARSCTLCRQMKAKCNATEQYPDPCTRCAHLGKQSCVIEPSFRRVNKRARIAEIQNELEALKSTVSKQRSASMVSRASSEYSSDRRNSYMPDAIPNGNSHSAPSFSNPFSCVEQQYGQGVLTGRVDSASEDELFLTFFTKFHPTLPILDHATTPQQTYNSCPLLYFAILLLASLATPSHPLTWSLRQTVITKAPECVFSANKSVHLVQAFLLLATWPQTRVGNGAIHDEAWMYVGIATHMAQCLGLHRSFLASEYGTNQNDVNDSTRREWVRTWVGCFIVSQFLSTALGVAPIIAEDFTIQNAPAILSPSNSSSYDPALSLLFDKLKIARVGARITGLLSSSPNSTSGLADVGDNLAIFRVLQGDLQETEASLLNADEAHGLPFLWVKIQLYSYALHDGMLSPQARSEFILRGFETSYHYLKTFSQTVVSTPIYLLPTVQPFAAVCSWIFVLKTLYSQFQMYLDISETEKTLIDVQKLISSKSEMQGDFAYSTGIYMDTLFQDAKANERHLTEPFCAIKSRMAAGLYYDGFTRCDDLVNGGHRSSSVYETKPNLASPDQRLLSNSLSSSPFLSSDDLSTPPVCNMPAPESFSEKQMIEGYWNEVQSVDSPFVSEVSKAGVDWLTDLTNEGPRGDMSKYVAPGLLMVQ